MAYHEPVLLNESIEGLAIAPNGVYLDLTFGGGGHSAAILERLGDDGLLIAFDQDADSAQNATADPRFRLVGANFRFFPAWLKFLGLERVDGILADLGLSSHQIDRPEKGFSHKYDGPLDMRMNKELNLTAADILNEWSEEELVSIFSRYGEIRNSKTLAAGIAKGRTSRPLKTSAELVQLVEPIIRGARNRYLSQLFQALRIAVNREMEALEDALGSTADYLKSGGRLSVISYHSLEDRMVKNFIRAGNQAGRIQKDEYGVPMTPFKKINNKPITPAKEEIERNPRSRSAKLRIAERL